jgi:hypothetical protein
MIGGKTVRNCAAVDTSLDGGSAVSATAADSVCGAAAGPMAERCSAAADGSNDSFIGEFYRKYRDESGCRRSDIAPSAAGDSNAIFYFFRVRVTANQ